MIKIDRVDLFASNVLKGEIIVWYFLCGDGLSSKRQHQKCILLVVTTTMVIMAIYLASKFVGNQSEWKIVSETKSTFGNDCLVENIQNDAVEKS